MPVIKTSAEGFVSVMGDQFLRKPDALGHGVHVSAQIGIWEGDVTERDRSVAPQFVAHADLRGGNGETRTFMNDAGIYFQHLPGAEETPHLGFIYRAQTRLARDFR